MKATSTKDREAGQKIQRTSPVHHEAERNQPVVPGAIIASAQSHNLVAPKIPQPYVPKFQRSKIRQPKIDATDRRQIEAVNEDKSHTTKEALDDIKRIHKKEEKKKELSNAETYPTEIDIQQRVSE